MPRRLQAPQQSTCGLPCLSVCRQGVVGGEGGRGREGWVNRQGEGIKEVGKVEGWAQRSGGGSRRRGGGGGEHASLSRVRV